MAGVARLVGDLETAEVGTARRKALDRLRRDVKRIEKETAAVRESSEFEAPHEWSPIPDSELGLIFACCHPALDPAVRVPLTLRSVCGLATVEIAAAFLIPGLEDGFAQTWPTRGL